MAGEYLNSASVLASCERIPCKLLEPLPKMGFLDSSCSTEDLKAGTHIELPFWLADSLSSKRPPLVQIEIPKVYKESYIEILKADACAVDLHKLGNYYYDFGCYLTRYDPRNEVGKSLVSTFRNRFRHIMDVCQNSMPDPMVSSKLDYVERQLVEAGQSAEQALKTWCSRSVSTLKPAPMVDNHRKRKHSEIEDS